MCFLDLNLTAYLIWYQFGLQIHLKYMCFLALLFGEELKLHQPNQSLHGCSFHLKKLTKECYRWPLVNSQGLNSTGFYLTIPFFET
jgi:hypothetical protein